MSKLPDEIVKQYWVKKVPKEIEFIFNESFVKKNKLNKLNTNLPNPYGKYVVLSIEQERELFLKFNYAKYRATKVTDSKNIRIHLSRAAYYKEVIAYHNIPLAHHRRVRLRNVALQEEELESEVFFALNRAIDKFDVGRGNKFSTYLILLINNFVFKKIKNFAKHRNILSLDAVGGGVEDHFDIKSAYAVNQVNAVIDIKTMFARNREIKPRERLIVNKLFGLHGKRQMVLSHVAEEFGVRKQRINRIKNDVFQKIRDKFEQVTEEDAALTR